MVELLAPAGNMDKLFVALSYGADAVYLSGQYFGLRSAADNFSIGDIERAVKYAHKLKKRVYLTVNAFPNNIEIDYIAKYLSLIKDIDLDALIIADFGVFTLAKELTPFNIHISTQTSVTNSEELKFWYRQGVKRVVLARELSIHEAYNIKNHLDIELEMFIHGSMCMSYSGKCTISNYTANRDANRGGCVNSCRWKYSIADKLGQEPFDHSYIMSSKDLCTIDEIASMINCGIHSLKIEGRMKGHLYLANSVSIYREAIDQFIENGVISQKESWVDRFNFLHNRGYTNGFSYNRAGRSSIFSKKHTESSNNRFNYIGTVKAITQKFIIIQVKNRFFIGDVLGFLTFNGIEVIYKVDNIISIAGDNINEAKANNIVYLMKIKDIEPYNIAYLKLGMTNKNN